MRFSIAHLRQHDQEHRISVVFSACGKLNMVDMYKPQANVDGVNKLVW